MDKLFSFQFNIQFVMYLSKTTTWVVLRLISNITITLYATRNLILQNFQELVANKCNTNYKNISHMKKVFPKQNPLIIFDKSLFGMDQPVCQNKSSKVWCFHPNGKPLRRGLQGSNRGSGCSGHETHGCFIEFG
ncbi:hypothetical protein VP01_1011g6 [Puccinia sorghi]|uniref:Uncharacterized protein n=1 Tax=Puccinia sorghi TaxID=27349 RepID=A0A0L6VVC7_9BASI|nr:hypothetical protein VP01_1011g6 [Puccinia sorghi]